MPFRTIEKLLFYEYYIITDSLMSQTPDFPLIAEIGKYGGQSPTKALAEGYFCYQWAWSLSSLTSF